MKITDLNNSLARFHEQKREHILEFAFTLLQWMDITPSRESKPQLLSPQTQKLKDFLFPAPQTVQPQLYRLSADGQNIRVRFAVLKKLKKEYISQLVDNDPGLTSYQAAVKGIVNVPGRPIYVPSEPYFIHFVTTPDYDKLVVVFNQGEQKRIVSFRRRLTATQYNKIVQQWQGIGTKSKPEIADLLWKSLDIKEVNKEFYKQIKERFDALLGIIKTTETAANENQIKQFTVRLIGRYIFCWFLKEKGIIEHSLIGKSAIETTENFYQSILLKLFFQTLNTQVQDRDAAFIAAHPAFKNIPYLNGGLFDESEEDKLFAHLDLDAWLLPFVEILESYDFTVDESNSQYQQVAVDPEMLGRIFENLLASQNEETEKLANQRKAYGAFYTPREIVDYMVNESIKAYLQTQWEQHIIEQKTKNLNNPENHTDLFGHKKPQQLALELKRYELKPEEKASIEKAIEPLFAPIPEAEHLKKEEKNLLRQFLEHIKILDPACGSGAFPMGILHRLVDLNETLGTVKSPYELKKDILNQNIYGVDIMPMAIEIARLRAWLSLVLEENYNPKDAVHNFGVKPLPNLDFKFVCANSLIDLGLDEVLANDTIGVYNQYYIRLKELEELRAQYFYPTLASYEKQKLKEDFLANRNQVLELIDGDSDRRLHSVAEKLKHWNPFDDSHPSPFFSPNWMFGIDKGFDVVIGNPPYVQIQKITEERKQELESQNFETYERTGDLYQLFYERGVRILKKYGAISFITSNKWMRSNYGVSTRTFFAENTAPIAIVDFGMALVFETATILTNIFIGRKNGITIQVPICRIGNDFKEPALLNQYVLNNRILIDNPVEKAWVAYSKAEYNLIKKIEKQGLQLKDWKIKINRGILTGCNEAFIIDHKTKERIIGEDPKSSEILKPILRGEDIKAYVPSFADLYLIATFPSLNIDIEEYKGVKNYLIKYKEQIEPKPKNYNGDKWKGRKYGAYEWFETQDSIAYHEDFAKPKIIFPNMTKFLPFVYDETGIVANQKCFILSGENLKYLTGVFNSKLWKFAFKNRFPELLGETFELSKVFFDKIPIKKPIGSFEKKITILIDDILNRKKANQDTTTLEREIDVLVYKLYELSYEEVKIIDPEFWLSEEEYEQIQID
jgi:methylase of polypeptide subunit release factors